MDRYVDPPGFSGLIVAPQGGGQAGVTIRNGNTDLGTFTTINFVAEGFTVTNVGGVATITPVATGTSGWTHYLTFDATAGQDFFPAAAFNADPKKHQVVRQGLVMREGEDNDYVADATGVLFTFGLAAGDVVMIYY